MRRAGTSRSGGFTLIELILVMAVILVLAGLVAPRLSDAFPSLQVRKTADHVFAWLRKARADAAVTGVRQRFVMDAQERRFWIESEYDPFRDPGVFEPIGGAWTAEPLPEAVTLRSRKAPAAKGRSGLTYVEFRIDGTATEAEITVSNASGETRVVTVDPVTSDVLLRDPADPEASR